MTEVASALPPQVIAPKDEDIKKVIDKLASYVARNGPEFENATREKQANNPKFAFLSGGENHAYYRWCVEEEKKKQ
eukprot:Ihof_evm3s862 gene=Ihof_evmTU3s862